MNRKSAYMQTRRQEFRARGYCSCGKNRDNPHRRLCLDCRQAGAATTYAYRERKKRQQGAQTT